MTIATCKIEGCERPVNARGWCHPHWKRWRRMGDGFNTAPIGSQWEGHVVEWSDWYKGTNGYIRRSKKVDGKMMHEYLHRNIMEVMLGRSLVKGENVHHVNGDRADNRTSNLELWNTSQPAGQRVADKVAWAREILDLYDR